MHCYHKNDKLWRAAEQAFITITPQILWCMSHRTCSASGCLECDNAHTNPLDTQQLSPNEGVKWSRRHCTLTSLFTHCLLYQLCKYAIHTFFFKHGCSFPSFPPSGPNWNCMTAMERNMSWRFHSNNFYKIFSTCQKETKLSWNYGSCHFWQINS